MAIGYFTMEADSELQAITDWMEPNHKMVVSILLKHTDGFTTCNQSTIHLCILHFNCIPTFALQGVEALMKFSLSAEQQQPDADLGKSLREVPGGGGGGGAGRNQGADTLEPMHGLCPAGEQQQQIDHLWAARQQLAPSSTGHATECVHEQHRS